jgi:hypothetical protein
MKIYYLPNNVIEKIKKLLPPGHLCLEFNGIKADLFIDGVPIRKEENEILQ